jgi:NAD(P)-dependent dehydrogenase (short-subunit alcohol dehydrogenase family)
VASYAAKDIQTAFQNINSEWSDASLRVAVWNAGVGIWKEFLDITENDLDKTVEGAIYGPFAFAQEAISVFRGLEYVLNPLSLKLKILSFTVN